MMSEDLLRPCTGASGEHDELLELAEMRMPFGKYQGRLLIDLPEPYVVWFANNGFPEGKLGRMLQTVYEIKVNGLEYLFAPLRQAGGAK
jgi:uncharacterized protein (DUF3820 family)